MPIPLLADIAFKGVSSVPFALPVLKTLPWLVAVWLLKLYFGGANNKSERLMHSKVILVTGGTSGIGAAVVQDLASRGAQIIVLTHHAASDPFLVDYIDDLRKTTANELIYAEQVDLGSLQSIRLFATKWVDNAPPRRLDMVVLCADTSTPRFGVSTTTQDQLDPVWGINYLANFHLLTILSPALRAQPPDRDVRIIFASCASYIGGDINALKDNRNPLPSERKYETAKLATMVFAQSFQKHLDDYQRPDKQANNARVIVVDPGFSRTPGMRRWLTMGSLWGLFLYLVTLPLWWLILKSPIQGAQSFLRAAMEAELGRGTGGRFLKECKEIEYRRTEVKDEAMQKKLWTFSEKQVEALEKEGAVKRALAKKEAEAGNKGDQSESSSAEVGKGDEQSIEEKPATSTSRRSRKSLRIAPPSNNTTSTTNTQNSTSKGAPSAPGLHDILRSNLSLNSTPATDDQQAQVQSTHPLEARLANWQATQDQLKMNLLRRNFGLAEPVRRGMELNICREGEWRPAALGGSATVGGDVLSGRDAEITWEDVYRGDDTRDGADFHSEMESRMKMDS